MFTYMGKHWLELLLGVTAGILVILIISGAIKDWSIYNLIGVQIT